MTETVVGAAVMVAILVPFDVRLGRMEVLFVTVVLAVSEPGNTSDRSKALMVPV